MPYWKNYEAFPVANWLSHSSIPGFVLSPPSATWSYTRRKGWAIATKPPHVGYTGFNECAENLAAKMWDDYDIVPTTLGLIAHYVYSEEDYYFLYHFMHGGWNIFGCITLIGAHRKPLGSE